VELSQFLAAHPACVAVEISQARGSTPRDAGTAMLVSSGATWGTIGGGQLEYMAIDNARALLGGQQGEREMDIPLGPEIGQCCGGRTRLTFSIVSEALASELIGRMQKARMSRPPVFLFGSGHVGLALARALDPLPFAITVVETRSEALDDVPQSAATRLTAIPEAVVDEIAPGGAAIILTHDHALDFLIAEKALRRADLGYVGMIGSATKRATFARWLKREIPDGDGAESLMQRLVLPVGGTLVRDKRPEVIAALVAAELLVTYASRQALAETSQAPLPLDQPQHFG
jgi:xanthine dehydrogenase accessory factor